MKTHKFARKPFYVDAVRVSEANIEEVAAWCEGQVQETDDEQIYISVKVHRPLTERQTQAFVGDWVLFAGSGFKVYTPKAFDKSFEKVRTLTKAQADEAGIKVPHEPRQKPKGQKKPVPTPPRNRRPRSPSNPVISPEQADAIHEDYQKRFRPTEDEVEEGFKRAEQEALQQAEADALIAEVERDSRQ